MKKILYIFISVLFMFPLSSCFFLDGLGGAGGFDDPNRMVVREEDVLLVAKEKYSINKWIYTGYEIRGKVTIDEDSLFSLKFYEERYNTNFVNGDNIEAALTSFAGVNGGHDVQGRFSNFLCYVALGETLDGDLKFVYYNTNIKRTSKIVDTIGSSDYVFEVKPTEISDELFNVDNKWTDMTLFLNRFKKLNPKGFYYSLDRLTIIQEASTGGQIQVEFYKENDKVVYDIYFDRYKDDEKEKRLVYSTSDSYGVIYYYYGIEKESIFDISYTLISESSSNVILRGYVKLKEIDGTVLYSQIGYKATFMVKDDYKVLEKDSTDIAYDDLEFERGYSIDIIDGVDHQKTSKFTVYDFYIFYKKNN